MFLSARKYAVWEYIYQMERINPGHRQRGEPVTEGGMPLIFI
jgi:hypothetical protein